LQQLIILNCNFSYDRDKNLIKDFSSKVSEISEKAEFTPKNIQTKEDRVTTVYKITISIDNKDMKLKPGMPADIKIEIANLNPASYRV
jgi:HlyD family secretion protein